MSPMETLTTSKGEEVKAESLSKIIQMYFPGANPTQVEEITIALTERNLIIEHPDTLAPWVKVGPDMIKVLQGLK